MPRPFDPTHPFGIYLSMMDGTVDDLTGPVVATRVLAARIVWMLTEAGYSYALSDRNGIAAITLHARPDHHAGDRPTSRRSPSMANKLRERAATRQA